MAEFQGFGDAGGFPISLAVRAGDLVVTCAVGDHGFEPEETKFDAEGTVIGDSAAMPPRSIEEETRGTLHTLRAVLAEAGCALSDVIEMAVWLKDPRDFVAMNKVYAEFFTAPYPVRSVFRTGFMGDYRVEMKATAYKPLKG
jgi:enamine deaminase RidA (YjgF/YER057c/UK114 family)